MVLGNRRNLIVYLPPGYATDLQRRYPVLYLHDGQNVFDPSTATHGVAWEADKTAERLIRAGRMAPIIIVAIYPTEHRLSEYTPHYDPSEQAGGLGKLYSWFVLLEVKPFIDSHYRTRPGREHTAVAGSSLGGLISLAMARDHHEHIALCGALSPALWWCKGQLLRDLAGETGWMNRMRFWVDMGTREGGEGTSFPVGTTQTRRLIECFDAAGLVPGRDYYYWEVADGEHHETAWAARFDKVLRYFFGIN